MKEGSALDMVLQGIRNTAIGEEYGDAAIDELHELRYAVQHGDAQRVYELTKLRERVDYLESAIKLGGAAYRAARIGLGAPAVELDDYLGLKERAEKAERESDHLRAELRRVVGELDRVRAEPHLIEAGQTKYDAELWRARCQDAEAELDRIRAERDAWSEEAGRRETAGLKAYDQGHADALVGNELRAKVTRQRRELRRLNRDVALLRGGKVGARSAYAKAEEKPAEDRVVRVGDVWRRAANRTFEVAKLYVRQHDRWALGADGSTMSIHRSGEPLYADDWTLVSRKAER